MLKQLLPHGGIEKVRIATGLSRSYVKEVLRNEDTANMELESVQKIIKEAKRLIAEDEEKRFKRSTSSAKAYRKTVLKALNS